jgi:hypothetical protein
MRHLNRLACAATLALGALSAAACSDRKDAKVDDALNNDLSLAAQASPARVDSISALEAGTTTAPAARSYTSSPTRTVRRTSSSSTARSSSSSSGTYSSGTSAGTASAPSAPREVTVKHTKRDAAIGAAAGAVIGATTSKDKVKGGLIGAAAGGILGGVIGNNVDKEKKPAPPER